MNDWREWGYRVFAGRDVLAAYLLVLGLVWIALVVDVRPLQLPGEGLLVGFEFLQATIVPGVGESRYHVYRAAYLYLAAVGVAAVSRVAW